VVWFTPTQQLLCLPSKCCGVARKISVSVSLEPAQAQWLDAQEQKNSEIVRELINNKMEVNHGEA
jgi:hypothetical protein